ASFPGWRNPAADANRPQRRIPSALRAPVTVRVICPACAATGAASKARAPIAMLRKRNSLKIVMNEVHGAECAITVCLDRPDSIRIGPRLIVQFGFPDNGRQAGASFSLRSLPRREHRSLGGNIRREFAEGENLRHVDIDGLHAAAHEIGLVPEAR